MAMQTAATLIPGVVNHRIGRVAGDGGLERIVRTFHARFGSVKMGGAMTARDRLAYVFREGKHKSDAADVESSAGDKEALLRDADRIKASARVRRGPTAERILATQIVELPAESTAEQRKACAEAFVADWKARGHEAVAVVHMHGEEGPQPHLHVEVAARAVDADGGVDRSTALWTGPHGRQAVQAERRRNADLVNRTCDPDPPYHPGNFRDIGIERPAKKRIPPRPFREARTRSREERADLRPTIDEARALGHERRVNRLEIALANGAAQMYAVSAEKRAPLHEAHEQHRGKIEAAKAVDAWPPPPLRERLKQLGAIEREAVKKEVGLLEKQRDEAAAAAAKREKELKNAAIAIAARAGEELEARERQRKGAEWRAGELKTQRDAANNRATAAKGRVARLERELVEARQLSEAQKAYLIDRHRKARRPEPDLVTENGQKAAWAFIRDATDLGVRMFRKRQAWEDEKKRRSGPPPAEAEAWQVTAAEWMERLRDNSGGEYTDMTFAGIAPPVRIRREPDNELDWDDGKHKEWIYERANLVTVGWDAGADWEQLALEVHQEEIKFALYNGKSVPKEVLAGHAPDAVRDIWKEHADGEAARGGSSGGGRSSGGDDGGGMEMEMGGPVAGEKTPEKSRSAEPEIAPPAPAPPPVIERVAKRERERALDFGITFE